MSRADFRATRAALFNLIGQDADSSYPEKRAAFYDAVSKAGLSRQDVLDALKAGPKGIKQLNESLGVTPLIPFQEFIAYLETSLARLNTSESTQARFAEEFLNIFETGVAHGYISKLTRVEHQVEPRDLELIMHNQSPQLYRSLVELISNALDFSPKDSQISVFTDANGYRIIDRGKGMDYVDIFTKLLPPLASGARGEGVKSIGRFGLGFYTVGDHLQESGDTVTVISDNNPDSSICYKFTLLKQDDEIFFVPEILNKADLSLAIGEDFKTGTIIEVNTKKTFDTDLAFSTVKEYLADKPGAQVVMNNELVNEFDEHCLGVQNEQGQMFVRTNRGEEEISKILVNGILIEERVTADTYFVIDFPHDTRLSEARDLVEYADKELTFLKNLISQLFQSDLPVDIVVKITNALMSVILVLEKRFAGSRDAKAASDFLSQAAQSYFEQRNIAILPDNQAGHALKVGAQVAYLHPSLECVDILRSPLVTHDFDYVSNKYRLLVGKLKPDQPRILFTSSNILISEELYKKHRSNPLLLRLYINTYASEEVGEFVSREREVNKQRYVENVDLEDVRMAHWHKELSSSAYRISDALGITDRLSYHYTYLLGKVFLPENPDAYPVKSPETEKYRKNNDKIDEYIRNNASRAEEVREDFYVLKPEVLERIFAADYQGAINILWEWVVFLINKYPEKFRATQITLLDRQHELSKQELLRMFRLYEVQDANGKILEYEVMRDKKYALATQVNSLFTDILEQSEIKEIFNSLEHNGTSDLLQILFSIPSSWGFVRDANIQELRSLRIIFDTEPQKAREILEHARKQFRKGNLFYTRERLIFCLSSLVNPHMSYISDARLGHVNNIDWLVRTGTTNFSEEQIKYIERFDDSYRSPYERIRSLLYLFSFSDIGVFKKLDATDVEAFTQEINSAHAQLHNNWPQVLSNLDTLLNIPAIQRFMQEADEQITAGMTTEHAYIHYQIPVSLLNYTHIIDHVSSYLTTLSARKQQLIDEKLFSYFDVLKLLPKDIVRFTIFLKRIMMFANLDDEIFEYSLDLFASDVFYSEDTHLFSDTLSIAPTFVLKGELLTECANRGVRKHDLPDLFNTLLKLLDSGSYGKSEVDLEKIARYEERLIDIWLELGRLPKNEYQTLVKTLAQPATTRGNPYEYLLKDLPYQEIPETIRPYVIHFREGGVLKKTAIQEDAELEKEDVYQHALTITELTAARRFYSKDFWGKVQSNDEFSDWVKTSTTDLDKYLTIRGVLHAVFRQSLDPYAYIRELIQNAYDAIRESGGEVQEIHISEKVIEDSYVLEVSDPVGMSTEQIFGYLLSVEFSSKLEREDLIGKFGIGFMSIFQGANKVFITSGNGQQKTTLLATPIFNDAGEMIDIEVKYNVEQSSFKGTSIQKWMSVKARSLQSAFAQSAAIKYGSYVDSNVARIVYNEKELNTGVQELARWDEENLGSFSLNSGKGRILTSEGIYVREIPWEWYLELPYEMQSIVEEADMVFNLPSNIPLIRGRNDIAAKERYLPLILKVFKHEVFRNFLIRFARGEVGFDLLPYDYFWESVRINPAESRIFQDAAHFTNHGITPDFEYYQEDRSRIFYLMALIPAISYNDRLYSLRDLATMVMAGYKFETDKLPQEVARIIGKGESQLEYFRMEKNTFKQNKKQSHSDFIITPEMRQTIEKEVYGGASINLIMHMWEALTTLDNVKHTAYYQPDGSAAHAGPWDMRKGLNWNSQFFGQLLELFWHGPEHIVRSEVLYRLIETSTHEDAHLREGTSSINNYNYTHGAVFRELHLESIMALMDKVGNINKYIKQIVKMYPEKRMFLGTIQEVFVSLGMEAPAEKDAAEDDDADEFWS